MSQLRLLDSAKPALNGCMYCGDYVAPGTRCPVAPEHLHGLLTLDAPLHVLASAVRISGAVIQLVPAPDGLVLIVTRGADMRISPVPFDAPGAREVAEKMMQTLPATLRAWPEDSP